VTRVWCGADGFLRYHNSLLWRPWDVEIFDAILRSQRLDASIWWGKKCSRRVCAFQKHALLAMWWKCEAIGVGDVAQSRRRTPFEGGWFCHVDAQDCDEVLLTLSVVVGGKQCIPRFYGNGQRAPNRS